MQPSWNGTGASPSMSTASDSDRVGLRAEKEGFFLIEGLKKKSLAAGPIMWPAGLAGGRKGGGGLEVGGPCTPYFTKSCIQLWLR